MFPALRISWGRAGGGLEGSRIERRHNQLTMSEASDSPREGEDAHLDNEKDGGQPPRKRQRVRLSCLECRRRKLSCDRELPCRRCLQGGMPEKCEYESRPGLAPGLAPPDSKSHLSLPAGTTVLEAPSLRKDTTAREQDRIRRLEREVAQLKGILARKVTSSLEGNPVEDHSQPRARVEDAIAHPFAQMHDNNDEKEDGGRVHRSREIRLHHFRPPSAVSPAFAEVSGTRPSGHSRVTH